MPSDRTSKDNARSKTPGGSNRRGRPHSEATQRLFERLREGPPHRNQSLLVRTEPEVNPVHPLQQAVSLPPDVRGTFEHVQNVRHWEALRFQPSLRRRRPKQQGGSYRRVNRERHNNYMRSVQNAVDAAPLREFEPEPEPQQDVYELAFDMPYPEPPPMDEGIAEEVQVAPSYPKWSISQCDHRLQKAYDSIVALVNEQRRVQNPMYPFIDGHHFIFCMKSHCSQQSEREIESDFALWAHTFDDLQHVSHKSVKQYRRDTDSFLPVPPILQCDGGAYADFQETIQYVLLSNPAVAGMLVTESRYDVDLHGDVTCCDPTGSEKWRTHPCLRTTTIGKFNEGDIVIAVPPEHFDRAGPMWHQTDFVVGRILNLHHPIADPDEVRFDMLLYGEQRREGDVVAVESNSVLKDASSLNVREVARVKVDELTLHVTSFSASVLVEGPIDVINPGESHPPNIRKDTSAVPLWLDFFLDGAMVDTFVQTSIVSLFAKLGNVDNAILSCPQTVPIMQSWKKNDHHQSNWDQFFMNLYPFMREAPTWAYLGGVGVKRICPVIGTMMGDGPQALEFFNARGNTCFECHTSHAHPLVSGDLRTLEDDRKRYRDLVYEASHVNPAGQRLQRNQLPRDDRFAEPKFTAVRGMTKNSVQQAEKKYDIRNVNNTFFFGTSQFVVNKDVNLYGKTCVELMHTLHQRFYENFLALFRWWLSDHGMKMFKTLYRVLRGSGASNRQESGPFSMHHLPVNNGGIGGDGRAKASHRYATESVMDVLLQQLLVAHRKWCFKLVALQRNKNKIGKHKTSSIFKCNSTSYKGDKKASPMVFFAREKNRRILRHMFHCLHLLCRRADSSVSMTCDEEVVQRLIFQIQRAVQELEDVIPKKLDPLRTPSCHVIAAHLPSHMRKFGPLKFRKVDVFEGLQGSVRKDSQRTNRKDGKSRCYQVVYSNLFRCCLLSWIHGGVIIPHCDEYLALTATERREVFLQLVSDGFYLQAGSKIRALATDEVAQRVVESLSPSFFASVQSLKREECSLSKPCKLYYDDNGTKKKAGEMQSCRLDSVYVEGLHSELLLRAVLNKSQVDGISDNVVGAVAVAGYRDISHVRLHTNLRARRFVKVATAGGSCVLGLILLICKSYEATGNRIAHRNMVVIEEYVPSRSACVYATRVQYNIVPSGCRLCLCDHIRCVAHVFEQKDNGRVFLLYNSNGDHSYLSSQLHVNMLRCSWEESTEAMFDFSLFGDKRGDSDDLAGFVFHRGARNGDDADDLYEEDVVAAVGDEDSSNESEYLPDHIDEGIAEVETEDCSDDEE